MSQRKAKEYRRAMGQYKGMAEDVDDLKRRIGSIEARHRREDQADEDWKKAWSQRAVEAKRIREKLSREEMRMRAERNRWKVRRKNAIVVCMAIILLVVMWAIAMTCMAVQETDSGMEPAGAAVDPILFAACVGEDPAEAEKIEKALLEQGYYSEKVPLSYDLQDIMRTACEQYGCPYALALAVAEVESGFDLDAVGAAGEVGIMQLDPGPGNTYWTSLEKETSQNPTTQAGNIVCGVYLLGDHLARYGDMEKAVMAYNMGDSGAERAWENGTTSTEHSEKVMEAMARWEAVVD